MMIEYFSCKAISKRFESFNDRSINAIMFKHIDVEVGITREYYESTKDLYPDIWIIKLYEVINQEIQFKVNQSERCQLEKHILKVLSDNAVNISSSDSYIIEFGPNRLLSNFTIRQLRDTADFMGISIESVVADQLINNATHKGNVIITNDTKSSGSTPKLISETIRERIKSNGGRFFACDNISEYIQPNEKQALIDEAALKFESILDSLLVDRENDPNSRDTGRRMAKMYINELFSGRYDQEPDVAAFPNDDVNDRFTGMLVSRVELKSVCAHHHQPVTLEGWIAIIPGTKVIGLSKYSRLAQNLARRGTLQEELTQQIVNSITKHTGSKDVGVVLKGAHGCMENRGCMAHNSTTVTALMSGQFHNNAVKQEFMNYINTYRSV